MRGRTQFYRTSNGYEHHFSNIERTGPCSSIGNWTGTPGIEWRDIERQTFNRFAKLLIELTRTSFFRTLNKIEHVHLLDIKHRTSNIFRPITKHCRALILGLAKIRDCKNYCIFRTKKSPNVTPIYSLRNWIVNILLTRLSKKSP